jgi:organic hydroperoxide reductase OsmC/OhrA
MRAEAGVRVMEYVDEAEGVMEESPDGSGRFLKVTLKPWVVVAPGSDIERAQSLHGTAHAKCFIANSVNFPIEHEAVIVTE